MITLINTLSRSDFADDPGWVAVERSIASRMTSRFYELLSENESVQLNKRKSSPTPELLQKTADELDSQLLDEVLSQTVNRFPKLFDNNPGIVSTRNLQSILPSLKVPVDGHVELETSPCSLAYAAGLGSFFGATILSSIARVSFGVDSTTLVVGATAGGALMTWCAMKIAADEKIRKAITLITSGIAITDVIMTVFFQSIVPGSVGKKVSAAGGLLARSKYYALILFGLMLIKRKKVFRKEVYSQKLGEVLFNRVEQAFMTIVVVTAAKRCLETQEQELNRTISQLKSDLAEQGSDAGTLCGLVPLIRQLWETDIYDIPSRIHTLGIEVDNVGYDLPVDVPLKMEAQLQSLETNRLPPPATVENPLAEIMGSEILVWSPEMESRYKRSGFITPGDKVMILEQPITRDGNIVERGIVTRWNEQK